MSLIIDPGHGGTDPGAMGNGIIEKVYNLEISLYQYRRFKELKVPVKMTRTTDKTIEPNSRTKIVSSSGMNHCISNHVNAGGGDGVEVIHSLSSNAKWANLTAAALKAAGQNLRRVFKRQGSSGKDYYYMHRQTGRVETIIVEYGFLDSKGDDVSQLKLNQIIYAESVIKAYCQYAGYKYMAPKTNADVVPAVQESAEAALPDGVIKPSDKYNESVRIIQTYLNFWLGANAIDVDGYFGPNTEKHLTAFQKSRGLAADGVYGPNTKRELIEFYADKLSKEKPKQTPTAAQYFVQVGAFGKRENAEAQLAALKKAGFSAVIKTN